jgi:hypothetical protein
MSVESCSRPSPVWTRVNAMPKTWGLTKEQAGYKAAPKADFRCDHCEFMWPRTSTGTCKYVRGLIKASYTCKEFSPRKRSEGPTS